jgi:O-antigen/teichoic acid export membrane protein
MRLPRGNVFWSGLEAGVSAGLSCVSAFLIARIVGPAELGIGAAAVAPHVLLWVGVNALFADALVQQEHMKADTAESAFWASCAVGCLALVAQIGMGWLLCAAFADARLLAMSALLALALPLVGAAGAVQGLLTRNRAYRVLAGRAIVGQGLGTLTGILAALAGAGAWALVLQQLVVSAGGALALLLGAGWRPGLVWHWPTVRALLRIGLPLTASTLVQHGRYRLFALLIGGTAGPAALGQVHLAFRLVDAVRDLMLTALWRLMLPAMAERQHDRAALLRVVDRFLAVSGMVAFPVCGALLLGVAPLVRLLLGPIWGTAGEAAQVLTGLMAYLLLGFPASVASVARGQVRYALHANLAATLATVLGVLALHPRTPLQAVAVWLAAQLLTGPYVLAMNAKVLSVGLLRPLRAGLPTLAATGTAVLAAWLLAPALSPALLIPVRLSIGAAAYLLLVWFLLRAQAHAALRAVGLAVAVLAIVLACPSGARADDIADYFPPGVPGYDTWRGVTVASRLHPLTDPPGIHAGDFLIRPALEEGIGYDDNVLGGTRRQGSWDVVTRPSVLIGSDWSRDSVGAYLSLDDTRYLELPRQDRTDWTASLGGAIDIGRDRLSLAVSHMSLHESRTDIDAIAADAPIAYRLDDARAAYALNLNRLSVTPNIDVSAYRYQATTILGVPTSQASRDRDVVRGGLTLRYELAPDRGLLLLTRATGTRYTVAQPGSPSRDSTGYEMLAGLDYDYDGIWRWRLLAGWEQRDFAARRQYGAHAAPIVEAGAIWTPTGLTTLIATLSRSIEDAAQEGVGGYTLTSAKLSLDHEYLRDVLLRASAGVQTASYTQGGGNQTALTLGTGATWLLDRNIRLSATYGFTVLDGTRNPALAVSGRSIGNVVMLTVRFAL